MLILTYPPRSLYHYQFLAYTHVSNNNVQSILVRGSTVQMVAAKAIKGLEVWHCPGGFADGTEYMIRHCKHTSGCPVVNNAFVSRNMIGADSIISDLGCSWASGGSSGRGKFETKEKQRNGKRFRSFAPRYLRCLRVITGFALTMYIAGSSSPI